MLSVKHLSINEGIFQKGIRKLWIEMNPVQIQGNRESVMHWKLAALVAEWHNINEGTKMVSKRGSLLPDKTF